MSASTADAIRAAEQLLSDHWTSKAQAERTMRVLRRLERFLERAIGSGELGSITPTVAATFVQAAGTSGAPPSLELQHRRRLALRVLFRAARAAGLAESDPTLDLRLPPRAPQSSRPLTGDEITGCRGAASWSLSDTRRAAAFALAEATGRTREIAAASVDDLDLNGARVWLHDGGSTLERWGHLSPWGIDQLRRLHPDASSADRRLIYQGDGGLDVGQISVSIALRDVLDRAGLAGERVRPSSIAAWAGTEVLRDTGRIDVVAQRLGIKSLDRAARFIGWNWRDEPE